MAKPGWVDWLVDTGERLRTVDGKPVMVLEFRHESNETVLSAWAKHLREHYCLDTEVDYFRKGYGYSRAEFLNQIKFPDASAAPGPSIRAGDFGEILVADYLEYLLRYWIPRVRYDDKAIRNESTKGCDIIGFKIVQSRQDSPEDTLAIFEAKTQFSASTASKSRLQDAIDGSAKDHVRRAESLNAIKRRLYDRHRLKEAERVARFQNLEDRPYREVFGAVALFSVPFYDPDSILTACTQSHPNADNLMLVVIQGSEMMRLVHDLYRRAADEA